MTLLKQKPGKSTVLEDGRILLICDKGWRVIYYPLIMLGSFLIWILPSARGVKEAISTEDTIFDLLCIIVLILAISLGFIFTYKTVLLSKEGAVIKIGKYECFFKWHELYEKRIESYEEKWRSMALFSLKSANSKPDWLLPRGYAFLRPFTSFYVMLDYDWDYQQRSEWEGEMVCFSEPMFMEKMKNWDVELEQVKVVRYY